MTDNKATRTTFVRTRPALHEAEAEARCYEAEAENFRSRQRWPQELNISAYQQLHMSTLLTLVCVA